MGGRGDGGAGLGGGDGLVGEGVCVFYAGAGEFALHFFLSFFFPKETRGVLCDFGLGMLELALSILR